MCNYLISKIGLTSIYHPARPALLSLTHRFCYFPPVCVCVCAIVVRGDFHIPLSHQSISALEQPLTNLFDGGKFCMRSIHFLCIFVSIPCANPSNNKIYRSFSLRIHSYYGCMHCPHCPSTWRTP